MNSTARLASEAPPDLDSSAPKGTRRRTLSVGLLGAGYIADWHVKALRAVRGASITAVCDRDPARVRAFGKRHGISSTFESLDAMLQTAELDAVHVLLPPEHHCRAAREIIDSGRHVLLEKPMGIDPEECSELIDRAASKGVQVGVSHNFLFSAVYEGLKADLASGRLGKPDLITITWNKSLDQLVSGPFNAWMFREPEHIVWEVGSHSVAHMLDLLGPVELARVQATNPIDLPGGRRFYRRWQVDADRGGARASLVLSFGPGFTEHTIHVRGSLAAATADFERNTYTLHQHTTSGMDIDRYRMLAHHARGLHRQARRGLSAVALSKFGLSEAGNPYGASILGAVRRFYEGLPGPPEHRLSGQLGRDVVALCAEIGRRAQLPRNMGVPAAAKADEPARPPEILVLGATGFIGRELVRQLLDRGKGPVRVLVRDAGRLPDDLKPPAVEVIAGDASNEADLARALEGVPFVYHLARATAARTWEEYHEQEVRVTHRIAEACLRAGVKRFLYTGTIDSYYAGSKAGTITEQTPLDPRIERRNKYARAKAVSEAILMDLHREQGLPVAIFRPGIVLGRGGSPFHWGVGMWSRNAVCQLWGEGTNPLPLVLVEDVADALVRGLDVPEIEGESFNLVADPCLSASEYLRELEQFAGITLSKHPTPFWKFYTGDMAKWMVKMLVRHPERARPSYRDWETRSQRAFYDCTKAKNRLGWRPASDRDAMVRRGIHAPASEFLA
jgi:nucleoside-diphosphate-sugar epimerase/predicted dehydrogenase